MSTILILVLRDRVVEMIKPVVSQRCTRRGIGGVHNSFSIRKKSGYVIGARNIIVQCYI